MKKLTILFSALFFATTCCFAWGPDGHKMVAEIAKSYLNKNIQDSVQKYLGTTTFEEAAVWMDEIKKDHSYDYMKTWHYINIEKDKTYVKNNDENIVNKLEMVIEQLSNKQKYTPAEINTDLKILFHLTGDLHMPLHAGYASDRGGNDEKVDFLGRKTNLHHVWDEDIIKEKKITPKECLALAKKLSKKQIKEIQKTDVLKWMEDSRVLLPQVYAIKDGVITQEYIDKNTPVIKKQLLIAGLRLANVLNTVFK